MSSESAEPVERPVRADLPAERPAPSAETVDLAIRGMHCGSCVALLEEVLVEEKGVSSADVKLDPGTARVSFDPSTVTADRLCALVADQGYEASVIASAAGS